MLFVRYYNDEKIISTILNRLIDIDLLEALDKELEKFGIIIFQLEDC